MKGGRVRKGEGAYLLRLLNHLTTIRGNTGRDGKTGQLPDRRAREPIDGVRTDLQRQLPTVQHRTLEWIRLLLQVCLRALTRRNQILENSRQQTLPLRRLHEEV